MQDTKEKIEANLWARIKLNVGGKIFETTEHTLISNYKDSLLANMFVGPYKVKPDKHGVYFIDRDGTLFGYVLNFLRDSDVALPSTDLELAQLEREARYYGLPKLENLVAERRRYLRSSSLQQRYFTGSTYAPLSSGTASAISQYSWSYSSGSGFAYGVSNASEISGTLPLIGLETTPGKNDAASELFVGSSASHDKHQPQSYPEQPPAAEYKQGYEGPFGPPIGGTTHSSLEGPFGPPLTDASDLVTTDDDGFSLLPVPKPVSSPTLDYDDDEDTGF